MYKNILPRGSTPDVELRDFYVRTIPVLRVLIVTVLVW
jgi:hypothetical protein